MTIIEAISQTDDLIKNSYSREQKITWLSRCEAMIYRDVIDHYEGEEDIPFTEFNKNTDLNTKLIMPQPYDEGYIYYLAAHICYANDEISKYNDAIAMFNGRMDGFKSFWQSGHEQSGGSRFRF